MSVIDQAEAWWALDPDPDTRAELRALLESGDEAELERRFAGRLMFGTAGLRAPLGAGPLRMNRVVVRQATAGLMRFLPEGATVVIGYDARHKSDVFAQDVAGVVAAAGGRPLLLPLRLPTPVLAFAVCHLGTDAGVMVTASHNPPADNGYKVYLHDGAQIVPPADVEIAAAIDAVAAEGPVAVADPDDPRIEVLGADVVSAYLDALVAGDLVTARDVNVVYTAMHGVGRDVFLAAFGRAGFPAPTVVVEQCEPDPDFPTVAFPNPEEPGALDLSLERARAADADVVLANDPDADRLGVAVPDAEDWRSLTGDEIGSLLADHVLRNTEGDDRLVATTIVSSRLLSRLAAAHGVHYAETLTGFKWIVRPALEHPEWRFVFGYEEALGYLVGDAVHDKDGIGAALAFAGLVADLKAQGQTVHDRLDAMAEEHGLHATRPLTLRFDGADGLARIATLMAAVRQDLPSTIGGREVEVVRDLLDDPDLPETDALLFSIDGDARVVIRPSGTEPKLKCYLEVVEPVAGDLAGAGRRAATALDALVTDLEHRLAT
ncbi:MAG TPA: phospho-sugar mutase [Acidimicrobiales bacterium]